MSGYAVAHLDEIDEIDEIDDGREEVVITV
jgi:hypothetical protein